MAKTIEMIGLGIAPAAAQAINGTISDGLTAAGNSQGTALALPSAINIVTTTAASSGVILPANPTPSDCIEVVNLGANSLSVYPATGGAIQAGAANAAFAVGAGKTAMFTARAGSVNWLAVLSA